MPFYISLDGSEKKGPYTIEELEKLIQKEELKPSHLVWRNGLSDWVEAQSLSDLDELFARMPPPLSTPPPLNTNKNDTSNSETKAKPVTGSIVSEFSYPFFKKLFNISGSYLSGWEFIWVSMTRSFLGVIGMLPLFYLIVTLSPSSVAWLSEYEDFIFPLGGIVGIMITRAQRARSVGGESLMTLITVLDVLALFYRFVVTVEGETNSLATGIFSLYALWSLFTLLSDSYSPDKGSADCMWDALRINSLQKKQALSTLLSQYDILKSQHSIPSDTIVVPRPTPDTFEKECQSVFHNPHFYLAVMNKRRAISIHDWSSLPETEKSKFYRVQDGFPQYGALIEDLKNRCSAKDA